MDDSRGGPNQTKREEAESRQGQIGIFATKNRTGRCGVVLMGLALPGKVTVPPGK